MLRPGMKNLWSKISHIYLIFVFNAHLKALIFVLEFNEMCPFFVFFFSPENIDQKSNKNVQEEDLRFSEQEIGERKTLESLIQVCIPKEDGKIQKTLFENWVEIASWIKTVKNSSEILATK